jgi:hypothetical protein
VVFDFWPLPIFPEGALASSVITCVWAGVAVTAFFNLRFGWTLSGVVVPGYLVPLLISKPWAAVAIYIEAVVAYLFVRMLSERLSRAGLWSSFFGRDRFFALILASVIARMVFDLWLIPEFGSYLADQWGLEIDYRNELHSFGLVVVALTANQLWKPGLLRGSACLAVTVGCTFMIVRFGLMEATNFSISNLKYVYEDVAGSIQAAPKAYIVLITTSFIASRLNLRYGWDFNGILVPSLLALQWYQPSVILMSFLEALLILLVSGALLRTNLFANFNIEGARKLVFFFNIGFLWKIVLAHGISTWAPGVDATDAFGYGYLLSTLMALKMYDREIAMQFTRVTVQASLVSILLATVFGLVLTHVPRIPIGSFDDSTPGVAEILEPSTESIAEWLTRDRIRLYRPTTGQPLPAPMPGEIDAFQSGVAGLLDGSPEALRQAASDLSRANYQLVRTSEELFYLREFEPIHGWGAYAINLSAETGLLLESPLPVDEPASYLASAALFSGLDARALAIAGSRRDVSGSPAADVLRSENTIFQAFHLQLAHENVIQIRSPRPSISDSDTGDLVPSLYVTDRLPKELRLRVLDTLLGDLELHWEHLRGENRQRDARRGGFAELVLSASDIPSLSVRAQALSGSTAGIARVQHITARFDSWFLSNKDRIARRGSEGYQPMRVEDLLYLDEEILSPLFEWTVNPTSNRGARQVVAERHPLYPIAAAARAIGYQLLLLDDPDTRDRYAILTEANEPSERRSWGTHVFRVGAAAPYIFQVTRPLIDKGTFGSASGLFARLKGRALLAAGAHALSNADGSANLQSPANANNLINLATQVILRESRHEPALVAQISAFDSRDGEPSPDADMLIAIAARGVGQPPGSLPIRRLLDVLKTDGMKLRMVEGEKETAGYEVGVRAASLYSNIWPHQDFAILWISPETRLSQWHPTPDTGELQPRLSLQPELRTAEPIDRFTERRLASRVGGDSE